MTAPPPTSPPSTPDDASAFIPADLESLDAWLAARLADAQDRGRERVQVPVFKRLDAATCACLPFAIGGSPDGVHRPIQLVDLTSIGTAAYAEDGVLLWVEGRFSANDDPLAPPVVNEADAALPTLQVVRASKRTPSEPPVFKLAR